MMTRRRCSRFASAKVRLFLKPAKGCERFFKKMKKKSVERTTKGREREGTPYYILYRVYKKKKKEKRKQEEKRETRITMKKIVRTLLSMRTTYL